MKRCATNKLIFHIQILAVHIMNEPEITLCLFGRMSTVTWGSPHQSVFITVIHFCYPRSQSVLFDDIHINIRGIHEYLLLLSVSASVSIVTYIPGQWPWLSELSHAPNHNHGIKTGKCTSHKFKDADSKCVLCNIVPGTVISLLYKVDFEHTTEICHGNCKSILPWIESKAWCD